jgi:hypothetical protein
VHLLPPTFVSLLISFTSGFGIELPMDTASNDLIQKALLSEPPPWNLSSSSARIKLYPRKRPFVASATIKLFLGLLARNVDEFYPIRQRLLYGSVCVFKRLGNPHFFFSGFGRLRVSFTA